MWGGDCVVRPASPSSGARAQPPVCGLHSFYAADACLDFYAADLCAVLDPPAVSFCNSDRRPLVLEVNIDVTECADGPRTTDATCRHVGGVVLAALAGVSPEEFRRAVRELGGIRPVPESFCVEETKLRDVLAEIIRRYDPAANANRLSAGQADQLRPPTGPPPVAPPIQPDTTIGNGQQRSLVHRAGLPARLVCLLPVVRCLVFNRCGEPRMQTEPNAPLILVADDDPHIVRLLSLYLEKAGYRVAHAADGDEALAKVRDLAPDLLLLDIMMPGPDGLEVCRGVRRGSDLPIIILSARGADMDKIAGLQFGADDYVTKPFNPAEVVARVQSVLRRAARRTEAPAPRPRMTVADLTIDLDEHAAWVGGQRLLLRPKEFDLLATFVRFPGFALDRDRLLDLVWGSRYYGDQRTVDVHVAWLREKLSGSRLKIQTIWGVGYKLIEAADTPARPRKRGLRTEN